MSASDPRLKDHTAKVTSGACIMVPKGTEMILCAGTGGGFPYNKTIRLSKDWFVEATGLGPEIDMEVTP